MRGSVRTRGARRAAAGDSGVTLPIGTVLQDARREAGLTPYEVAAATRIRPARLLEMERDDFSGCGGSVYARGQLRSIAIAVGLDPEPLLAGFEHRSHRESPQIAPRELLRRRRPPCNWSAVLAAGLLIPIGYGIALVIAALFG